jgi:hypothetical protein
VPPIPDPDSNVRAPTHLAARTAAIRLARAMLKISARVVLLGLCAIPSFACVIPVAPSFSDPPASANYPPYVTSATPDLNQQETIVTSLAFTVTVGDPNVNDDLNYEWVVDFPPFTTNTRTLAQGSIPHNANGSTIRPPISVVVNCNVNLATGAVQHQLLAIIADRSFSGQGIALDEVVAPGFAVRATWPFQISCPEPASP